MKSKLIILGLILSTTLLSCSCEKKRKLVDKEKSFYYYYSVAGDRILYHYDTEIYYIFVVRREKQLWAETPADAKTFEVLSEYVGKDKDHIYIGARVLDFVDYQSFRCVKGHCFDKNNVYELVNADDSLHSPTLKVINGIDAQTYQTLGTKFYRDNTPFAKDKNNIYFKNKVLKDVDYKTFKVLSRNFYADRNFIYKKDSDKKFVNKNHSTEGFINVHKNSFYSKKYFYYYHSDRNREGVLLEFPIKNIQSVRSFKNPQYFIIDGNVYFDGKQVKNVDSNSLKVYDDFKCYARDKNYFIFEGKIVPNVNPSDLKYVNSKRWLGQIWYRGKIWDDYKECFRKPDSYEKEPK